MRTLIAGFGFFATSLIACPPSPGPVGPPDVVFVDAAPYAVPDGAMTPCQAACARLEREGCPTLTDCPAVYSDIEKDKLRPRPDKKPLTCADIVSAVKLEDVGLRCP